MNFKNSYFSVANPLQSIDRWLHPYRHQTHIEFKGNELTVEWTKRAARALEMRRKPLIAEMQLYFTCVVKKRVIFHDQSELETVPVTNSLLIAFRTVESSSCDPVEFAENFPVKQELQSSGANRMHPSKIQIDYQQGNWEAEFYIG